MIIPHKRRNKNRTCTWYKKHILWDHWSHLEGYLIYPPVLTHSLSSSNAAFGNHWVILPLPCPPLNNVPSREAIDTVFVSNPVVDWTHNLTVSDTLPQGQCVELITTWGTALRRKTKWLVLANKPIWDVCHILEVAHKFTHVLFIFITSAYLICMAGNSLTPAPWLVLLTDACGFSDEKNAELYRFSMSIAQFLLLWVMEHPCIIAAQPLKECPPYAPSGQLWCQKHIAYCWKHAQGH